MTGPGWIESARRPVSAIAAALGWPGDDRRGYPCPACNEARRDDRRGAVYTGRDGAWKCYRCDAAGDWLDYLSHALHGRRFRECDRAAIDAVKAWLDVPVATPRTFAASSPAPSASPGQPAPNDDRPPIPATPAEVAAFWNACGPAPRDHPFLAARRLDPSPSLARFTPLVMSWPAWWPGGRARAWRLVTRGWRFTGYREWLRTASRQGAAPTGTAGRGSAPVAASIHGRAVVALEPREPGGSLPPKVLWARDTPAEGLLFWNEVAPSLADLVLVVEGMTDWLAASCWAASRPDRIAVLGLTSGGAVALDEIDVPRAVPLVVATDDDPAGDAYAEAVAHRYRHRRVLRVHPSKFAARRLHADHAHADHANKGADVCDATKAAK